MLVMTKVQNQELSLAEAAVKLEVCYRQARRIFQRFEKLGAHGLVHRSRGRGSNRAVDASLKREVLKLFKQRYADYGPTLATEVLRDDHGLKVHKETLRRWLHAASLMLPKSKPRLHRRRRERRGHFGELVQIDGSFHDWFEDRGPRCCLMVAVDDATGRAVALMSQEETLAAAYGLLGKWVAKFGVPEALYADKRNVYHGDKYYVKKNGKPGEANGDFLRACRELGIDLITAHSPQAKGRVERMNGTLQDRLVKEFRRRKINSIEQANAVLDEMMDRISDKFSVAARKEIDRHRQSPAEELLNRIFSREKQRKVQNDWVVSCENLNFQILKQDDLPQQRTEVTVRQCQDGNYEILHNGKKLKWDWAKRQKNHPVPSPRGEGTAAANPNPCDREQTTQGGHF